MPDAVHKGLYIILLQQTDNFKKIRAKQDAFSYKKESLRKYLMKDGQLLTDARRRILSTPILKLADMLRGGVLDPLQVLEAFQVAIIGFNVFRKKLYCYEPLTNCDNHSVFHIGKGSAGIG